MKISDHHRELHKISKDQHVVSHKVVIAGRYLARSTERGRLGGAAEKQSIDYEEAFTLTPREHCLHEQGALAEILKHALPERLLAKNPNFRGVQTHHVVSHENVLEDMPVEEPVDALVVPVDALIEDEEPVENEDA